MTVTGIGTPGARGVVTAGGTEVAIGIETVETTEEEAIFAVIATIIVGGIGACQHLGGTATETVIVGIEQEVDGTGVAAKDARDVTGADFSYRLPMQDGKGGRLSMA